MHVCRFCSESVLLQRRSGVELQVQRERGREREGGLGCVLRRRMMSEEFTSLSFNELLQRSLLTQTGPERRSVR